MTDLERRALLGDEEAFFECTNRGTILPCPFCGSKARPLVHADAIICTNLMCTFCIFGETVADALYKWNKRPAPPIGRCVECANAGEWTNNEANCHANDGCIVGPDDFCSQFEPKGRE